MLALNMKMCCQDLQVVIRNNIDVTFQASAVVKCIINWKELHVLDKTNPLTCQDLA